MSRIIDNLNFLKSLSGSCVRKRKLTIFNCTIEELKSVIECIFNFKVFNLQKSVKCSKKVNDFLKLYGRRRVLKIKPTKTHLSANNTLVSFIVSHILERQFNEALLCVYSQDGNNSSYDNE